MGAAGAAGLGTGTWLSSRPRQLVYLAGVKAMTCAVDAVLPLDVSADDRRVLRAGLDALGGAIGTTTDRARRVRELLAIVESRWPTDLADLTKETRRDLATVETLLQAARSTYTAGVKLEGEVARAGQALIATVDRLGAEVDRQITATLPDPQALSTIVGGLAQVSGQFTKLPERPKAEAEMRDEAAPKDRGALQSDEAAKRQDELHREKGPLKDAAIDLENRTLVVAALVDRVAELRPLATLKQCGVETVDTGITVAPPGPLAFRRGRSRRGAS